MSGNSPLHAAGPTPDMAGGGLRAPPSSLCVFMRDYARLCKVMPWMARPPARAISAMSLRPFDWRVRILRALSADSRRVLSSLRHPSSPGIIIIFGNMSMSHRASLPLSYVHAVSPCPHMRKGRGSAAPALSHASATDQGYRISFLCSITTSNLNQRESIRQPKAFSRNSIEVVCVPSLKPIPSGLNIRLRAADCLSCLGLCESVLLKLIHGGFSNHFCGGASGAHL